MVHFPYSAAGNTARQRRALKSASSGSARPSPVGWWLVRGFYYTIYIYIIIYNHNYIYIQYIYIYTIYIYIYILGIIIIHERAIPFSTNQYKAQHRSCSRWSHHVIRAEGLKDNHAQSKDISLTDVWEDDHIASKKTVCIHVDTWWYMCIHHILYITLCMHWFHCILTAILCGVLLFFLFRGVRFHTTLRPVKNNKSL